jgi:hypothetical protein
MQGPAKEYQAKTACSNIVRIDRQRKDARGEDMRQHTVVIKGVGSSACDEEVEDST